jgi:hypothetical protein
MFLLLQLFAAIIPFVKDAGIVEPQDHLSLLSPSTPDLANELRLRHNSSSKKSYAASVAAKRASSAQEEADRVTAEAAAAWRRLHLAEGRRDRYNERVHPFGEDAVSDDPDVRAEERRVHSTLRDVESRRARVAASSMHLTEDDRDDRVAAITGASRERRLARARAASQARHAAFKEVRQHWDSAHPCKHCAYVWLVQSSEGLRKKCCKNGQLWNTSISPFILEPLPDVLESGMYSDEFVRSSNQYNNILSLGAVGVDNANETRGWDRVVGHAAVRLSGRTYHYIPQINHPGALSSDWGQSIGLKPIDWDPP